MSESEAQQPTTETAPFYIQIRAQGTMICAYMAAHPNVKAESREPVLIGAIMRAPCDDQGGSDGPLFKQFVELMAAGMVAVCQKVLGMTPVAFTAQPGGSVEATSDPIGDTVGSA